MLSSTLLHEILEAAPDGMMVADASGTIVFANRQAAALFGYAPEELPGLTVETLMPERYRARHVERRAGFIADARVRPMGSGLELFARRKDGAEFPVEISLSPVTEDGETVIIVDIRDVSERRKVQAELRRAREEADRANFAKSRFLATASHDLRQPVQALELLHGTLQRMSPGPAIAEILEQQERAIGAMSKLLNALLDIGKLESGAVRPEVGEFRVAALFEDLRAEFGALAVGKGLRLEVVPSGDRARSDPVLVGQALSNLVANAIKYTREGRVVLRSRREGQCVHIEVADTGIGIPAGELSRICEDFYQVGVPGNVSREGYGLGLGIVSRIAQLLGARLEVRSEPGKGSAFSLELPAALDGEDAGPDVHGAAGHAAPGVSARAHILLVEDDPGVRNATRMLLRAEGHEVSTAASLEEAQRQVTEHPGIRVVISDFHLGAGETGLQVIEAVRTALGPGIKAILMTGDTSVAMQGLARDSRLRTASKPVKTDELLGLIGELLRGP